MTKSMTNSQKFYSELKAFLTKYPYVRWKSETDSVIKAVRVPWYRITFWGREKDGVELDRLRNQLAIREGNDPFDYIQHRLLAQDELISIKRPDNTLYILARFGQFWYVGIKMNVVES